MDFITAFLVYMGLTAGMNLQAAPTPEVTPVPTETPYVVEMQSPDEDNIRVVGSMTVTAAPSTPTPLPTITPNPAYKNLGLGDKGDAVRKLQQRLKDLGYLSGNVDGSYGYQTRTAVMLFQQHNYLTRDGVAGKSTQTRLFDDPDVIPNPEVITPSPEPTATPDAYGLIPLPENPREIWRSMEKAQTIFNGSVQMVTEEHRAPQVFMRGSQMIFNLSDLLASTGTEYAQDAPFSLAFTLQGYEVNIALLERVATDRQAEDTSYVDGFSVTIGDTPSEIRQGDVMWEDGVWYVTDDFIRTVLHGECRWDAEENTEVITVRDISLAQATD